MSNGQKFKTAGASKSCVCVCARMQSGSACSNGQGRGWVLVCYRPSGSTIMARVAARTPITVWLVLASVNAIKTKRRLDSKQGFYSGSRVIVRHLGVYLACVYIFVLTLFSYSVYVAWCNNIKRCGLSVQGLQTLRFSRTVLTG